jgi:hypothetical protein
VGSPPISGGQYGAARAGPEPHERFGREAIEAQVAVLADGATTEDGHQTPGEVLGTW